jgi:antitoxin component YwqK of YwqJK toxin-antitoxin module
MRKFLLAISYIILVSGCGKSPSSTSNSVEQAKRQPVATEVSNELPMFTETKDTSGKVLLSGYLLNGRKESSWADYYDTGVLKSLTTYYHDKREGISMEFTNNGSVLRRCNYHNDLREGEYKEYNYGNVREERRYLNGKIEGIVKIYYDNTLKVMEEGSYKNGLRDGVSKWYDQNGNVSIEYIYENGELVKK